MATQQVQQRAAGGIAYTLTRRRVRNINLRVRADGSVAASASARVPAAYVDAFVAARADWVRAAQQRGEPMDHILLYGPPGLGKSPFSFDFF